MSDAAPRLLLQESGPTTAPSRLYADEIVRAVTCADCHEIMTAWTESSLWVLGTILFDGEQSGVYCRNGHLQEELKVKAG